MQRCRLWRSFIPIAKKIAILTTPRLSMKAYFISGLGADQRAFRQIALPSQYEVVHLNWVPPLPKECIVQYARRFAQRIDPSEKFILVGLSFGGLLATELSKIIRPERLILISSAATRRELPLLYRLFGNLRMDKLFPFKMMKKPGKLSNWLFGPMDAEVRSLMHSTIQETDLSFLKWAVGEIIRWKNGERPDNLLQIHGSKDKLFWPSRSNAPIIMSGGGHLCLHSHAGVINQLLANQL